MRSMANNFSSRNAFTLIELLIVIAIIAILAAILFTSIGQTPLVKSRDAKRTSDLDSLRTALTLYYTNNNGRYPGPDVAALTAALVPTYIATMPVDPRNGVAGCNQTYGGNANYKYLYTATTAVNGACTTAGGTCTNFVVQTCLEDATNQALSNDCDSGAAIPACIADNVYDIHS